MTTDTALQEHSKTLASFRRHHGLTRKYSNARYMRISFWGSPRAHEKYTRLRQVCEDAVEWLRANGGGADANELAYWMGHTGGFTREHMPWYVVLTMHQWNMLAVGIRRGEGSNTDYNWVRFYGTRL